MSVVRDIFNGKYNPQYKAGSIAEELEKVVDKEHRFIISKLLHASIWLLQQTLIQYNSNV